MKIYLAGPITGRTGAEVVEGYEQKKEFFEGLGYEVLHPMTGKGYLRTHDGPLASGGFEAPISVDHAIFGRDKWMVRQADIVFVDLSNADNRVSIGSVMELAIAHSLGKHTVVTMHPGSVHDHAFVREAADVVFPFYNQAIKYLEDLVKGRTE